MESKDRNILKEFCRNHLVNIVINSTYIKESISFKEQVGLCDNIMNMSYDELVSYTFNEGEILNEIGIRDFETKFKKFLKFSLAILAGGGALVSGPLGWIAAPTVAAMTYYLYRKVSDPCWQQCIKKFGRPVQRKVCKYECQRNSAKRIVSHIRSEMSKCKSTPDPLKCQRALQKEYIKWAKKLEEQEVKLQQANASMKEKERKEKEKI